MLGHGVSESTYFLRSPGSGNLAGSCECCQHYLDRLFTMSYAQALTPSKISTAIGIQPYRINLARVQQPLCMLLRHYGYFRFIAFCLPLSGHVICLPRCCIKNQDVQPPSAIQTEGGNHTITTLLPL